MPSSKTMLIIKNTGMLFFRMFLTMAISLYTSRVLLEALGVEDYGIYNVVGGVVTLLAFFNLSMVTATQRFFSFELGSRDHDRLKKTFSLSITIQLLFALFIIVIAETIGLWFLKTQMNFPSEKRDEVFWVYQVSILTFVIHLIQTPYTALIIARERMIVFSYVSILDAVLKLAVVFVLLRTSYEKLVAYSFLILVVTLIVFIFYLWYCRRYKESKPSLFWNKAMFNDLLSYAGWNMFGGLASVGLYQATNILINIFYGPTVNAARGLSIQLKSAVSSFSSNIRVASNPQIIKSYASNDLEYMNKLLYQSTKFSYILMLLISIPLLVETDFILSIWLKNIPEYTVIFCKLFVINNLIDCVSAPLVTPIQATGRIKKYQIISGITLLLNVPITYLFFFTGSAPESAIYINIVITFFVLAIRLVVIESLMNFSILRYLKELVLIPSIITVISIILPIIINLTVVTGFLRLVLVSVMGGISAFVLSYFLFLNSSERKIVVDKILILKKQF